MIESGTILENRYLVQKRIGEGGMGTVYLASDQRFNSPVAIKETLFDDPDLQRAFEREAQLLNGLRHPALPRVSDHFVENSRQFIVMEYIPGEDLSEMLRRQPDFPVQNVLHWADQLLDALEYLHSRNPPVIHRDIKPQNLKLTPRGQIILLDFGLAKGKPGDTSRLTAAKSVFGYSRSYSPLEQIQGAGTDPRSDLYSLAATLYHLLTGKPPVDALTRATKVLNGESDPLVPISQANQAVPLNVAQILVQALALNANVRPVSAAAMRQELQPALTNQIFVNQTQPDSTANYFDGPNSTVVNLASVPQQIGADADREKSSPISIDLTPDVELTRVAEIESKNLSKQNNPTDQKIVEDLPIVAENELTNIINSENLPANVNVASSSAVSAPDAQNRFSEKRQSRSWTKAAGVAAALILAGGSLAAWYATTASETNQSNNQTPLATNVSVNKNPEAANLNNKAAATVVNANASAQNFPTTSIGGTAKITERPSKSASNISSSAPQNEENRETADEEDAPPPAPRSNVVVVKSAPHTSDSVKNKREIGDSAEEQDGVSEAENSGSSIEIRDLRNLPAEERERIIDGINRQKTQAERRQEKLERREQRRNAQRNQQQLPTILGAPPDDQ